MKIRTFVISSAVISTALAFPTLASAQDAVDALRLSQSDLKGTARFMSMGGAFGALGGDLSVLSQNPGGIGVYRSHELGFTLDLDAQNANSSVPGFKNSTDQTKFYLNNIGGVLTLRLNSSAMPNLNFGFTYNKTRSFNRRYAGNLGQLNNSMTNWMAGVSNANGVTVADVTGSNFFNPYDPNDGGVMAPWISTLAYQSFLINPIGDEDAPNWEGQWADPIYSTSGQLLNTATSGVGEYEVWESGCEDSFNIAFGGNINNVVYWGMDFDISNLNYQRNTYYRENLTNAYVESDQGIEPTTSDWSLQNYYKVSGTGFTYRLGVIVRPIQELRIGLAFHTPTFYSLNNEYSAMTTTNYNGEGDKDHYTNDRIPGGYSFRFRSPWRVIVSAAGVIGSKFIISADCEWAQYSKMRFSDPPTYDYYNDYWSGPVYNSYDVDGTNARIGEICRNNSTFRIGAEYRVTPKFSVRLGYCNVSSPVKEVAKNGSMVISTAGTQPDYTFDNSTNYITAGLGYRLNGFYADLAYVHKHTAATYHAFTDDPSNLQIQSPKADLGLNSDQVVLSLGYKF